MPLISIINYTSEFSSDTNIKWLVFSCLVVVIIYMYNGTSLCGRIRIERSVLIKDCFHFERWHTCIVQDYIETSI